MIFILLTIGLIAIGLAIGIIIGYRVGYNVSESTMGYRIIDEVKEYKCFLEKGRDEQIHELFKH